MEKKSAKDRAFDRERAMFRNKMNKLERISGEKDAAMRNMRDRILDLEDQVRIKDEWIERLLEYIDCMDGVADAVPMPAKEKVPLEPRLVNRFCAAYSQIGDASTSDLFSGLFSQVLETIHG